MPAWAATAPTHPAAWSWPPLIRLPCRRRPPGTWPPTCPTPRHPTPPPARTRPPTWPTSCASTALRPWIEQSYKQIKDELGWADFQVRSDRAIRRHQTLVNCAFSFCRDQWFTPPGPLDATAPDPCSDRRGTRERGTSPVPPAPTALLAQGLTRHPLLAHPRRPPQPMVASLDGQDPTTLRAPSPDRRRQHRTRD